MARFSIPGGFARRHAKRRSRAVAGLCAALLLLLCFVPTAAVSQVSINAAKSLLTPAQKKSEPAPASIPPATTAPAPPAPQAIPLPDVASRSEDLTRLLRSIVDQLPNSEQLTAMHTTLNERGEELASKQNELDALLAGTPSSLEIREAGNYWRATEGETAMARRQLLDWANEAQLAIQQLQTQLPQWSATLQENESTPELGPTLDVIKQSVKSIKQLQEQAQDQLRLIVNLQIRAGSEDQLALDNIDRLTKAETSLEGRLFERDSLPLWELTQRREVGESPEFFSSTADRLRGIRAFARDARGAVAGLAVFLLLSLFITYHLHIAARRFMPADTAQANTARMIHHWVALGALPVLLTSYLLAPLAPLPLIGFGILISFLPILTLLPPLIEPRLRPLLYWLAGAYLLNATVSWMSLTPPHKREATFLVNLVVLIVFIVLVRPVRMAERESSRTHRLRVFGVRLAVLVLGISLAANLFGYVKLSQFLAYLSLYSTFVAVSIFTGVRVFTLLLLQGMRVPAAQEVAAIRLHRDAVARWGPRLMLWAGSFVWLTATLDLLGMRDWVGKQISAVLNFRLAGSTSDVTLKGVLGFFLILVLGYAISSVLRFLLREELLSRFHLSRGLPELLSSTLHYLLLLLVFFLAVNAGGVELNKFTVLTGALGVGVGFGLQNIVNNFVSGLILQFERPIHIGDVLDIDGTTGKVSRIGIRSSTVKTFQGAEVIIPNANFISGKVINWTLSSSLRRAELPVGVAYGSDVKQVSKLLEQAACTHESVLTSPAPAVYFTGFGDSSLNFELQFWVMQESNATKVKSEVALEAMRLLDETGIEIPFPQRDLRVRAVDGAAAAALLSANGAGEAGQNGNESPQPKLASDPFRTKLAGER
ncbi:MAG: mechanosensitive ion channel domain-containing protein [Candidatus Korobacteraceae bacterium]